MGVPGLSSLFFTLSERSIFALRIAANQLQFTFLRHDGVSWNNNNAEHAIKAFARLRRTIEGLSTPKGIEEYLVLLSVCQTCKYSGLDFLGFLRSGETDIGTFVANQLNRRRNRGSTVKTE